MRCVVFLKVRGILSCPLFSMCVGIGQTNVKTVEIFSLRPLFFLSILILLIVVFLNNNQSINQSINQTKHLYNITHTCNSPRYALPSWSTIWHWRRTMSSTAPAMPWTSVPKSCAISRMSTPSGRRDCGLGGPQWICLLLSLHFFLYFLLYFLSYSFS